MILGYCLNTANLAPFSKTQHATTLSNRQRVVVEAPLVINNWSVRPSQPAARPNDVVVPPASLSVQPLQNTLMQTQRDRNAGLK